MRANAERVGVMAAGQKYKDPLPPILRPGEKPKKAETTSWSAFMDKAKKAG